ncbi:MAG: tRNA pseudouridine(55) synthase TruB [Alphaproteobacteria bacterium]|nr:tRNA pseudouridine(55) synthase TruB [Alphaproteobacteria bacterium]
MGRRNKKGDKVDGWVNLDKPLGMTSTQAVGKIRRIMNGQKVGHAGTLDPLASGVLPIALGEATKTIPYMQDAFKTYEYTVTWGEQRSTDDAEGEVMASSDVRPARDQIEATLPVFMGQIVQTPPKFSAIKIDGQRAYDLARKGEAVTVQPRDVYVESLELLSCDENTATFLMTCGKGTYVRSIARDMALQMGTYGYVSALRRMAVGCFDAQDTISLEMLEELEHIPARDAALLPVQVVLDDIPALEVKQAEVTALRNGRALSLISRSDFQRIEDLHLDGEAPYEALAIHQGTAIAIVDIDGPQVKPVRVFNI